MGCQGSRSNANGQQDNVSFNSDDETERRHISKAPGTIE